MAAAITDEVRTALPDAIAGWEREAQIAAESPETIKALGIALGRYIALTGTQMGIDAREEWIAVAVEELGDFPITLLLESVKAARRSEPRPNYLVPTICEKIEAKAGRLAAEGVRLRKLAELA